MSRGATAWDDIPHLRAVESDPAPEPETGVSIDDFRAYMPMHNYIYLPTRALWPAASVNARIPPINSGRRDKEGRIVYMSAAAWLDRNRPVEQMTWAPGLAEIIEDWLLYEGGWREQPGARAFNQYLAPAIVPGDAMLAKPWVEHVRYVYPDDAEHIMDWLAHRVQRPGEKVNHALVLGGGMGIGKDTLLAPAAQAIGQWNFAEASPSQICGNNNAFVKSVILRISEARDLGEVDRFAFYDHTKTLIAAPPDVLTVNEKHIRQYPVLNVCGVIITTNHKTDGIYLPAEDRRHYVAWSDRLISDPRFAGNYWMDMYHWYATGGNKHVAAYLLARDLSAFDPKAPPPKTAAFWAIVDASRAPEEGEMNDVLDGMNRPKALTLKAIQGAAEGANGGLHEWLIDRKSRRQIPHRLEKCGYVPVRNPDAADGLWKGQNGRRVIYAQAGRTLPEQLAAARNMTERSG